MKTVTMCLAFLLLLSSTPFAQSNLQHVGARNIGIGLIYAEDSWADTGASLYYGISPAVTMRLVAYKSTYSSKKHTAITVTAGANFRRFTKSANIGYWLSGGISDKFAEDYIGQEVAGGFSSGLIGEIFSSGEQRLLFLSGAGTTIYSERNYSYGITGLEFSIYKFTFFAGVYYYFKFSDADLAISSCFRL